jgi:hypothetical protein
MIHVITIPIIIFLSYIVYAIFFNNFAEKYWKSDSKWMFFVPRNPRNLRYFIIVYKVLVTLTLILITISYILKLTGVDWLY